MQYVLPHTYHWSKNYNIQLFVNKRLISMNSMGTNRKILWPNQLYWLWFVWKSFIEMGNWERFVWFGGLIMTDIDVLKLYYILIFFVSKVPNSIFPTSIKRQTLGLGGWGGGTWEFKGVNIDNKHIKHHQECTVIDEVSFAWNVGHKFSSKYQLASFIPPN